MTIWAQLMLLGLGTGAIYAALAIGLVATYRGAGVINFAHGAIAMYGAYIFHGLTAEGDVVVPLIVVPSRFSLGGPVDPWLAFAITVVLSAAIGLGAHALIFRHLRRSTHLARLIASVGLLLILQGIAFVQFGSGNVNVRPLLERKAIDVPFTSIVVTQDRLLLLVLVLLVAAALTLVYDHSRVGLVARAAAADPDGAELLGYSTGFVAAANWAGAAALAGAIGALAASITGLDTTNYILFVVPAMACALAGRFESFPIAAATGVAFGFFDGIAPRIASRSWFPEFVPAPALARGLPLAVIVTALFLTGSRLPERGKRLQAHRPLSPTPVDVSSTFAVCTTAGILAVMLLPTHLRLAMFVTMATTMLLLSIVVLTGWMGQVSLAQAISAGAAGFATAILAESHVPFPLSTVIGAVVATAVGVYVTLPALRIRGVHLAIVTMATGVAFEELLFRNPEIVGSSGGRLVEQPNLFGLDLAASRAPEFNRWQFGVMLAIVTGLCCALAANVRRGQLGRAMLALRSNERAASAAGIDPVRTKVIGFALSSFVAGLGGAFLAYLRGAISATSFSVFASLVLVAFAYVGGISSITGAILGGLLIPGGLFFEGLDSLVPGDPGRHGIILGGIGLVVASIVAPGGIAGELRERWVRTRPAAPDEQRVGTRSASAV